MTLDRPPTLAEEVDACNKERDLKGEPRLTEAEIANYAASLAQKKMPGDSGVRFGDKTVQLPTVRPESNWEAAAGVFSAVHDAAVIIEMDPWETERGGIELPSEVQERLRPQSGTVIACGRLVTDLKPGDWVIVGRTRGMWVERFSQGAYEPKTQVRAFGPLSSSWNIPLEFPYSDGVLGRIEVKDMTINAIRDKVLLRRDPPVTSEGIIDLPDEDKYRPPTGTVVSAGPAAYLCKSEPHADPSTPKLEPGDRVIYNQVAAVDACVGNGELYGLDGDVRDYCFIKSRDVLAVLTD